MAKDIVYHYCSVDTFYSIITNKTLRLSDLNKTNDYAEKIWSHKAIKKAIIDIIKELTNELKEYKGIIYPVMEECVNEIENNITKVLKTNILTLIVCFSGKSDKLSQWRGYGDDGKGVSIGFDLNKLELLKGSKYNENFKDLFNIKVQPVIYDDKKQYDVIKENLYRIIKFKNDVLFKGTEHDKKILKFFNGNTDAINKINILNELINKTDEYVRYILPLCCFIKNKEFIEEKEHRILYTPVELSDNINNVFENGIMKENFKINKVQYLSKNDQLVAFSDISFDKYISEGIIKEIILGPKCKLNEYDVKNFLRSVSKEYNADKIKIKKSTITYR